MGGVRNGGDVAAINGAVDVVCKFGHRDIDIDMMRGEARRGAARIMSIWKPDGWPGSGIGRHRAPTLELALLRLDSDRWPTQADMLVIYVYCRRRLACELNSSAVHVNHWPLELRNLVSD